MSNFLSKNNTLSLHEIRQQFPILSHLSESIREGSDYMTIKQPTEQEIQKIKRIVFRTWKIKLAEKSCGIQPIPSEFMMSSVNFGDHIEEILLEYRKLLEKLP